MYRVDTGYCISRVYTKYYWILDTVSSITVKLFTLKNKISPGSLGGSIFLFMLVLDSAAELFDKC